jgi:hypothetical protein
MFPKPGANVLVRYFSAIDLPRQLRRSASRNFLQLCVQKGREDFGDTAAQPESRGRLQALTK